MGMTPEEIKRRIEEAPEAMEVWPENWDALNVMIGMGTQWRIGHNGPTGLDYGALPFVMKMCGVPAADRNEAFALVRVMEAEALTQLAERKKNHGE